MPPRSHEVFLQKKNPGAFYLLTPRSLTLACLAFSEKRRNFLTASLIWIVIPVFSAIFCKPCCATQSQDVYRPFFLWIHWIGERFLNCLAEFRLALALGMWRAREAQWQKRLDGRRFVVHACLFFPESLLSVSETSLVSLLVMTKRSLLAATYFLQYFVHSL